MVDVERARGIDIAQRIVGERGEVHDGIESGEIGRLQIPDVAAPRLEGDHILAERAVLEEIRIHADDAVARGRNCGRQH